ncbi:hypothetical protein HKCCE2091_20880 [Rhodobacterales bacterium HKCCE2091]|nr:hypothetical protein [Rhodobacterales bacterium HKCCE2091]
MKHATASLAALLLSAGTLAAQEDAPDGTLSIELNTVIEAEGACRLTIMARNGLGADISALVLETVLLTREGIVERLTLFDFQAVPGGRPRVRQFDVAGLACADLGQVLVNGVETCAGDGIAAEGCEAGLTLSTRTDVEVTG